MEAADLVAYHMMLFLCLWSGMIVYNYDYKHDVMEFALFKICLMSIVCMRMAITAAQSTTWFNVLRWFSILCFALQAVYFGDKSPSKTAALTIILSSLIASILIEYPS